MDFMRTGAGNLVCFPGDGVHLIVVELPKGSGCFRWMIADGHTKLCEANPFLCMSEEAAKEELVEAYKKWQLSC